MVPLLPPRPAAFDHRLPGGSHVSLFYREELGTIVLFDGDYEAAETAEVCRRVRLGTTVFDVGANIGLETLELAAAAGPGGRVIAFEPHPKTAARLAQNLAANGIDNVEIEQRAVADRSGTIILHEAAEATRHSATIRPDNWRRSFEVPVTTLDQLWSARGRPTVGAIKIDVEGGEFAVLRGASELIARDSPPILLEAWGSEQLDPIVRLLTGHGYSRLQPRGFEARNHLFAVPRGDASSLALARRARP